MSYAARRPIRRKKDNTPMIMGLVALLAIPVLGFVFYKYVINKPPPQAEDEVYATAPVVADPKTSAKSKQAGEDWAAGLPNSTGAANPEMNRYASTANPSTASQSFSMSGIGGGSNVGAAVSKTCAKIKESVELGKTLVIWLVDASPSCESRRGEVAQQIASQYASLAPDDDKQAKPEDAKLLTAVCSFAEDVKFDMEEPTADPAAVNAAVSAIATVPGSVENTFRAIETVVNKFSTYAAPPHQRYLTVVVVSDEVGNDQPERDHAADVVRKSSVTVYVVGQAAAFGSTGSDSSSEGPGGVVTGPETREVEAIHLGFPGGGMSRSGGEQCAIGPYSLTYLCRESGGEYYPIASMGATVNLSPQYYPRYMSEKEYQATTGSNKAVQALVAASRMQPAKPMTGGRTSFSVDENGLASTKDIDSAMKPVALIIPGLNDLYDVLKKGESDRNKLTEPRQQAEFDTAIGRAMAAKVRAEGYIVLLAAFKAGRKMPDGKPGTWSLHQADGIEKNSVLDGMAKKSREYLQGVIDKYPGTPWAAAAQQELSSPIGWEWK